MSADGRGELSDKALISAYLEKKNLGKAKFTRLIGVSKSYLDSDTGGVGVDTIRKIQNHEELQDFNLRAFLERDGENIMKDNWQYTEAVAGQSVLIDIATTLTAVETSMNADKKMRALFADVRKLMELFVKLSDDYREVFNSRQILLKALEKIKGR